MSYTRVLLCILLKTSCLGLGTGERKVKGDRTGEKIIVVQNILARAFESSKMHIFISLDTELINFDHHLRCGGWLNFEFS